MSLAGETIADGVAPSCEDCGKMPKLEVVPLGSSQRTSGLSVE